MFNPQIYTLDANYLRKQMVAVYAIKALDDVVLVETANAHSLTSILSQLEVLKIHPEQVKYILLTHIHLDHAGGAYVYMNYFTNAQLVVHPRGYKHMLDPRLLEASARMVYGDLVFDKYYGHLQAIAKNRVLKASDRFNLKVGDKEFIFRDTPGHANHHNIIIETTTRSIFSGDVFGVAYPELRLGKKTLVIPSTSPVNFNPEKMLKSCDLICSYTPIAVYPTHYGPFSDYLAVAILLKRMIIAYATIAQNYAKQQNCAELIYKDLCQLTLDEAQHFGIKLSAHEILAVLDLDLRINAQGLVAWLCST